MENEKIQTEERSLNFIEQIVEKDKQQLLNIYIYIHLNIMKQKSMIQ